MELQEIIDRWNAQADGGNQWDSLDVDEKCQWVLECCNERIANLEDWIREEQE